MALFTDAEIVTLDDLLKYENSLAQVSSSHNIDVDTKIRLAVASVGDSLLLWLTKMGPADPQWLQRRQLGLSTVVVTSPLQRWLCFDSLARFFSEAYNVQLNTRFQGKFTEYQQLAGDAASMAFTSGIGLVYAPLPMPALPVVTVSTGAAPQEGMFVQTAWIDRYGNEGALSPVNGVILSADSSITVAMAGNSAPAAATGWNIYASTQPDNPTRQNNSALPIGTSWELPAGGLVAGASAINGQQPNFYLTLARELQRG